MLIKSVNTKSLIILSVAVIFSCCVLIGFGVYEFNSIHEMHHIINSNLNDTSITVSSLHNNIQTHLQKRILSFRYIFSIICLALIGLISAWYFSFLHLRREQRLKGSKEQLEELLYYEQLQVAHTQNLQARHWPTALRELRLNREKFTAELEQAFTQKQFVLHYQPIVNAGNDAIEEVEALIRWQHPTYGLLYPDVFLSACENNGLIIPIGEWVLRTACRQLKQWHDLGFSKLRLSVNLSARQLDDPQLLTLMTTILTETPIPASYLKLEITENALMRDVQISKSLLKSLSQIGVQISLDDFGTGYSSLNYLKQFPVSILKIDRTFIADLTTNITSLAIVESIITLGKTLGLMITAEGVETKNQLHILKKMKCDLIQGYLYSKPIPAADLTHLLHRTGTSKNQPNNSLIILNKQQYHYEVLQSEHYDQAVQVISHTFCSYEPMTQYLGITQSEFIPFAELMVKKAIADGLSIVALDNKNVSACTIVEDIADPLNITIDIDPRFKIIFTLLEQLGSEFFSERALEKGHIAHLFITAVDINHHGKGLSRKINFESIKLAREKGFDFMCCEFTHDYNEKGTVKNLRNSKLRIRSCVYKDFIFEGKKPFLNLEGAANAYIWELREGAQLRHKINANSEVS